MEAQSPVRGPTLGYYFSRELRPLSGIPGSAFLGAPIELAARPAVIEVSPRQDYALALAGEGPELSLIRLRADAQDFRAIPGIGPGVNRMAISPSGAAAALIAPAFGRVYVLRDLPDTVAVRELSMDGATAGPISAMAVSDDGQAVILAATQDTTGRMWVLRTADGRISVFPVNPIADVSFFRDSLDAAMASTAASQVLIIRDVLGTGSIEVLADERSGVASPTAVAPSHDRKRLYVPNRGAGNILSIPLDGRPPALIQCACDAQRMARLSDSDVFLLSGGTCEEPLGLDARPADPRSFSIARREVSFQ